MSTPPLVCLPVLARPVLSVCSCFNPWPFLTFHESHKRHFKSFVGRAWTNPASTLQHIYMSMVTTQRKLSFACYLLQVIRQPRVDTLQRASQIRWPLLKTHFSFADTSSRSFVSRVWTRCSALHRYDGHYSKHTSPSLVPSSRSFVSRVWTRCSALHRYDGHYSTQTIILCDTSSRSFVSHVWTRCSALHRCAIQGLQKEGHLSA